MKTKLIILEGVDGAGKSTLARMLRDHLQSKNQAVQCFSLPGQDPGTLGEVVYRLYHAPKSFGITTMTPLSIQVLMTAAHADTIQTKVLPALKAGHSVILDRFWWSTWVYARQAKVPINSVNHLLELEQDLLARFKPQPLFLIERKSQATQSASTAQLSRLYRQLARIEKLHYTICRIQNNARLEDALRTMIELGKLGEDHK